MKQLFIGILSLLVFVLTGCHATIHEHPDAGNASVTLTMRVKTAGPELYQIIEYTGNSRVTYKAKEYQFPNSRFDIASKLSEYLSQNAIDLNKWRMRLVWELYNGTREDIKHGRAQLVQRDTVGIDYRMEMPDHTINFKVPAGQYTLLAWSDFVPNNTLEDYYYDTQDMDALVSDRELRLNCLDNDQRDCFAQCYDFTIERVDYAGQERYYETTLYRPQGRYVVLATDYDKYQELSYAPVETNTSCISYPSFVNVGYSILEQRPNESATGLSYEFTPILYEFGEQVTACIADDYSFVNGSVSHVHINISVLNEHGNQLSFNRDIDIPLYADKLTVVIGRFLATSGGSGGISIDDKFEDEIVVPYSDDLELEIIE